MQQISKYEVIDIIPYGKNSAIIVEKKPFGGIGQFKASYSVINFDTGKKEALTKGAYLFSKFGSNYAKISEVISNFVQCSSAVLYDKRVLVIYPNGEAGIFSRDGELEWSGSFTYHDETVSCLALEGKYFWSVCSKENCIIRYSSQNMKVDLRIGAKDAKTFINPVYISVDNGDIYVCCDSNKIRKVDGISYTVSDFETLPEGVKRFQKIGDNEIIVLSSGTYIND